MLVNPGGICQMSIGSTVHSLRVFLRIEGGLDQDAAERDFTAWLSGRVLQDVYDDLKKKIASGALATHEREIPYSWYRCALFVAWLLDTGKAVDVMAEKQTSGEKATVLVAGCERMDDGDWVGQVRAHGRHGEIVSRADTDPDSPDLARWRKIQRESAQRKALN